MVLAILSIETDLLSEVLYLFLGVWLWSFLLQIEICSVLLQTEFWNFLELDSDDFLFGVEHCDEFLIDLNPFTEFFRFETLLAQWNLSLSTHNSNKFSSKWLLDSFLGLSLLWMEFSLVPENDFWQLFFLYVFWDFHLGRSNNLRSFCRNTYTFL